MHSFYEKQKKKKTTTGVGVDLVGSVCAAAGGASHVALGGEGDTHYGTLSTLFLLFLFRTEFK